MNISLINFTDNKMANDMYTASVDAPSKMVDTVDVNYPSNNNGLQTTTDAASDIIILEDAIQSSVTSSK